MLLLYGYTTEAETRDMNDFWTELKSQNPQGFIGLSPMDGVTDLPMRMITAKYGHPEVIFTEFTNVEGWVRGAEVLRKQLWTSPEVEGKTVAQLYGLDPQNFRTVAAEIAEFGFAGIDISMGCPAKNVAENGAGAGLIRNKNLAREIYEATVEGVANKLPVSIKTRLGFNQPEIEGWLGWILEELKPAALTVHGRTYKQAYAGQADWELIKMVAQMAQEISSMTVVLGNGDVKNRQEAEEKAGESGVAGVLVGRAAFGNPQLFLKTPTGKKVAPSGDVTPQITLGLNPSAPNHYLPISQGGDVVTNLRIALEHAQLYEELFMKEKKYSFLPMRKHLAWYARGFPGAAEVRVALTQTNSATEVEKIIQEIVPVLL